MKSILTLLACVTIAIFAVACSQVEEPLDLPPDEDVLKAEQQSDLARQESELEPEPVLDTTPSQLGGKIAILTCNKDFLHDTYDLELRFIQNQLLEKYGADQIQIVNWLEGYGNYLDSNGKPYDYTDLIMNLAADNEIKAVIIQDLPLIAKFRESVPLNLDMVMNALELLREEREDIFIACLEQLFNMPTLINNVDLVLHEDEAMMGSAMVEQAQRMGATTVIYYCYDSYLEQPIVEEQLALAKERGAALGIDLVERIFNRGVDEPIEGNLKLVNDIRASLEEFGKDTALFSPVCSFQRNILFESAGWLTINLRAIYPQPCHPSLLHSYIPAWNIDKPNNPSLTNTDYDYLLANPDYVMEKIKDIVKESNLEGRFGNWPVSCFMANMEVAVAYADQWMRGKVGREGLDKAVLQQIMEEYSGVEVKMRSHEEGGQTYDNYQKYLLDYVIY